jgi:hypothetical protein
MRANDSDQWTLEDEVRLRHLILDNTPSFEIALALGRTVAAVKKKAHSLGITLARIGTKRRGLAWRGGAEGEV